MPCLHVKQNYFEIISVFYFTVLKLFQNYVSDTEHVENIRELQQGCELIPK